MSLPDFLPKETEDFFPDLRASGYEVTSAEDDVYNCVSWAISESLKDRWLDPTGLKGTEWPEGVPKGKTIDCFLKLFETMGNFVSCSSSEHEEGFEKIAIYANDKDEFLHVARRLNANKWTSKLGPYEDISHVKMEGLHGDEYGTAKYFMKRAVSSSDSSTSH